MGAELTPTPAGALAPEPWITPFSRWSIGVEKAGMTSSSNPVSTAWGATNLALYVPFYAMAAFSVVRFGWYNGATAAGNVDVGILDAAGNKLLSSGATAQGTINVAQFVTPTLTVFPPGRYQLACWLADATATLFALPLTSALRGRWAGCTQEVVASNLPATSTPAAYAAAFLPVFGFSTRDTA